MLTEYDKKWIKEIIDEKLNDFLDELHQEVIDSIDVLRDYDEICNEED